MLVLVGDRWQNQKDHTARTVELPLAHHAMTEARSILIPVKWTHDFVFSNHLRALSTQVLHGEPWNIGDLSCLKASIRAESTEERERYCPAMRRRLVEVINSSVRKLHNSHPQMELSDILSRAEEASPGRRSQIERGGGQGFGGVPPSWTAESANDDWALIADGDRIRVELANGIVVAESESTRAATTVVVADDGSASVTTAPGGDLRIRIKRGRSWQVCGPLSAPDVKVIAMQRLGRSYALYLTSARRWWRCRVGSDGTVLVDDSGTHSDAPVAAVLDDHHVTLLSASGVLDGPADGLKRGLADVAIERWIWLDTAVTQAGRRGRPRRRVVAAIAAAEGGDRWLVATEGEEDASPEIRRLKIPADAHRVAVSRPHVSSEDMLVVIATDDRLMGWTVKQIPLAPGSVASSAGDDVQPASTPQRSAAASVHG